MSHDHPYPNCPACGGSAFDTLPDVGVELHRQVPAGKRIARQEVATWWYTLIVCSGCGKTDVFTRNVADLRAVVPGATQFRAVPPVRHG